MHIVTRDNVHFIAQDYVDIVTQIRLTVQSIYPSNKGFMEYIAGYWNALSPGLELDSSNEELFLESMKNNNLIYILDGGMS